MYGRCTLSAPGDVLAELFGLPEAPEVAAVVADEEGGGRRFARLKWRLVPHWADDPAIGNRMINARSESVAEKAAFRTSFKNKRCLVLADGFYEWQNVAGGQKQPWYFRLESGDPFACAGLWSVWNKGGDDPIESCTILTTDANPLVKKVHHRMPAILDPEEYDSWLDPGPRGRLRGPGPTGGPHAPRPARPFDLADPRRPLDSTD